MSVASETHRSQPLRFGLTTALPRGVEFRDFAVTVEDACFHVLTFPDHLVPTLSPFAGATAAAMATTHLHTGTLVHRSC
jgi:alkanesulfonate monooxygenase SsuD/methylene tetrahydromethanopterin reductase-like flavin-dependent oxidoreductase (luciferase family)